MQPGSFWTKKQFNADISGECASQLVEGKQTIAAQRWTFPTLRVTSLYCAKQFTLTFYRQTKLHNGWHLWSHGSKGWMKVPRPSDTHQKVSLIASKKRKSLNIARRSFGLFWALQTHDFALSSSSFLIWWDKPKGGHTRADTCFQRRAVGRIHSFNSYFKILPGCQKKGAQTQRRIEQWWQRWTML